MQSSIIQGQMNALSARIISDLSTERDEYLSAIAASEQRLLNAMESRTDTTAVSTITPATQTANVATTSNIDAEILKVLQAINESLKDTKGKSGNGKPRRKNTSKYCWTHGACAHNSPSCTNRIKLMQHLRTKWAVMTRIPTGGENGLSDALDNRASGFLTIDGVGRQMWME